MGRFAQMLPPATLARGFRVHIEPAEDGSLPPGGWRWTRAHDENEAIAHVLRRTHMRAERAWVAISGRPWPTGAVMVARAYRLEWSH